MSYRYRILLLVILACFLTACKLANLPGSRARAEAELADCPVTQPSKTPFIPPAPFTSEPPYEGQFWYGDRELWTLLPVDGNWKGLPDNDGVYTQKTFWWHDDYDPIVEPQPELTVTGKRLDAQAPPIKTSTATHGFHSQLKSFMLTGVDFPSAGCWEISGEYQDAQLVYVIWVAP